MTNAELLNALNKEVHHCQKCRLCETATQGVPGDGSPNADIVFVGEAPGFHEDQRGVPFVGRAGQLLDKMLAEIQLERQDVYITNVIKHRPPENRDPKPEEIAACKPYLDRQLEIIRPKMIISLGRFGLNYFFPEGKISLDHGVPRMWGSYYIYPVYHPAAALRNPKVASMLRDDFLAIPEIIKQQEEKASSVEIETDDDQMTLF